MNPFPILWPTFALVLLVFLVWAAMFVARARHMKANPPRGAELESGEAARRYFAPVEMAGNNLANLFEMPVLYFALVPLLLITRHADHVQVALAWAFVILRAVHSFIHIGPKQIGPRFAAYFAACVVLAAMWIGFFIDMITAAADLARVGAM